MKKPVVAPSQKKVKKRGFALDPNPTYSDKQLLRLIGNRIFEIRERMRLTQEKLAKKAEMDRSYLGGVERGERNPSFLQLCGIARALGRDVGALTYCLPAKPHAYPDADLFRNLRDIDRRVDTKRNQSRRALIWPKVPVPSQ